MYISVQGSQKFDNSFFILYFVTFLIGQAKKTFKIGYNIWNPQYCNSLLHKFAGQHLPLFMVSYISGKLILNLITDGGSDQQ